MTAREPDRTDDRAALAAALQRIAQAYRGEWFFEVSPLLERHWTGIPTVAAGLATALLDAGVRLRFFHGAHALAGAVVEDALARGSGLFLAQDFRDGTAVLGPARRGAADAVTVGIWPSVKAAPRCFDVECSIVHDLSTLVTPEFHTPDNIALHTETLARDVALNDLTFCVSEATAADLAGYLGVPGTRLRVAHNGVFRDPEAALAAAGSVAGAQAEPFVLILGTIEPRKNIALVMRLLAEDPGLLQRYRFVFAGRAGWLPDAQMVPAALAGAVSARRIVFTGFLDETEKFRLIAAAAATLYPSLYEGFGLPVAESLGLGTPCAASFSASIPEIGGDAVTHFDPRSVDDLRCALRETLARPRDRAALRGAVAGLSWPRMARSMVEALTPLIATAAAARAGSDAAGER